MKSFNNEVTSVINRWKINKYSLQVCKRNNTYYDNGVVCGLTHLKFPNVTGEVPNISCSDISSNFEKSPERRQLSLSGFAKSTTLLILAV